MAGMTFVERMEAERRRNAKIQEMLNLRMARNGRVDKAALAFWAAEAHKQYPQYQGHWDGEGWQVEVVTHRVSTKMGIAFEAGDVALVKRERDFFGYIPRVIAYSIRNGIDTSIGYN